MNTVILKNYLEIKCNEDVLIYSSKSHIFPPTVFRFIFGYNATTVLELVQSISVVIQEENNKEALENSSKILPYIIVFNG